MKIVKIAILENWFNEDKANKANEFLNKKVFVRATLDFFIEKAKGYSNKITEEHRDKGLELFESRKGDYVNDGIENYGFTGNECVVNLDDLFTELPFLHNFKVLEIIPVKEHTALGVTSAMLDSLVKFEALSNDMSKLLDNARKFNDKCDVHIGGGLLMRVREVMVLEDYCTEALQAQLDDGWAILAVCVQPDGRRPDYVVGRYNDK